MYLVNKYLHSSEILQYTNFSNKIFVLLEQVCLYPVSIQYFIIEFHLSVKEEASDCILKTSPGFTAHPSEDQ